MLIAVVFIDLVVVGVLLGVAIYRANRWPTPTKRPYACVACRVEYSDARALAWHFAGQHVDTYDHAVVNRHGAQGEPATGPVEPHETAGDGTYRRVAA